MRELLLITIDDQQYGIWKDEILSIEEVRTLHRLPLSPACVAGISIVDDRTVTLADLPVCIGRASEGANGKASILIPQGEEKTTGFMVRGELSSLSVPPDAVFSVPEYLKTDVIDSCAVRNAVPLPVINLLNLSSRIFQSFQDLPRASFAVPDRELSSASGVRVFELGGELFAAPSHGMENVSAEPVGAARLSLVPQYVKGIAFYRETLIPVIDLCQRIKRQKCGPDACMIVADVSGVKFGLLADRDHGTWPAGGKAIFDLPPISRSSSICSAVIKGGEIVPLADIRMLLTGDEKDTCEKSVEEQYTPDSQFDSLFGAQDVDVVEFLLLGFRHALPKSEIEDVIGSKAFRKIPDTPQIVAGVAEHNGTLLPVLDPATIFGRRSIADFSWQMILVKNGDFRAFVLTERAFEERRLPLDIQRAVPIHLPHRVVYGCYPDNETVRLILNIHAIAVHFEKSLLKELLPAFAAEMSQAPSDVEPSVPYQEAREAFRSKEVKPDKSQPVEVAIPVSVTVEPAEIDAEPVKPSAELIEERLETKQEDIVQTGEEQETAGEPIQAGETQEISTVAPDEAGLAGTDAAAQEGVKTAAEEEAKSEVTAAPDEALPIAEDDIPVSTGQEGTEQAVPAVVDSAEESRVEELSVQELAASSQKQEEPEPEPEPVLLSQPQPVFVSRPQPRSKPEPAIPVAYHEARSDKSSGRRIAYAAVAVLAILLYLVLFKNTNPENPINEAVPAKIEPVKSENKAQPPVETEEPPLVLDVPAEKAVNIDVYVVVKNDTLWSISERFTGNPFNYPRIAGENKIANPDLIFPGQRIRLVKK